MSASKEESKIDLLDDEKTIKTKLNKAFCEVGKTEGNGILAFAKHVLMVINKTIEIKRPEKFGGDVTYKTYEDLEKDFIDKKLHPMDLKIAVAEDINRLLKIVREEFKDNKLVKNAYPEK